MTNKGVVYIAIGDKALAEARNSADSLKTAGIDLPVRVGLADTLKTLQSPRSVKIDPSSDPVGFSRWCKTTLDLWTLFTQTLYMDADTSAYSIDLLKGFDLLDDGFDMVITPSINQERHWLWHTTPADRLCTADTLGFHGVQYQCGVFWWTANGRTHRFFQHWRGEWQGGQDQGAFMRALHYAPLRLWLFGKPFNGGSVIGHHFGRLRV